MRGEPPVDETAQEFRDLSKLKRALGSLNAEFNTFKYTPTALAALIARSDAVFNEVGAVIVNHFKTHRALPPASQSVYASWINLSGTLNKLRALTHSDVAALSLALDNTSAILENLKTARRTIELSKYLTAEALDGGASDDAAVLLRYTRDPRTSFDDIIGMAEEKSQIQSITTLAKFNLNSDSYSAMLLYGPPGTGKSSFVEAAARHMDAQYVFITNADLFLPTFGAAEALLASIFAAAAQHRDRLVLLFFDEIDTITGRDSSEVKASLTAVFLHHLDPKRLPHNVLVAAATNHIERVDPAIVRRLMPAIKVSLPEQAVIYGIARQLCTFLPDLMFWTELMVDRSFSQANVKTVIEATLKSLKIWSLTPGRFVHLDGSGGGGGYELPTLGRSALLKGGVARIYSSSDDDSGLQGSPRVIEFDESDVAANIDSIVYLANTKQINSILGAEIDALVGVIPTS